ncbi:non-ribosomal peptide synthetase, partial [Crocosphaera chwakensis]
SILLSRYSRQEDLAIGSPIANRNREEIEPLIGFFVNTLVMRVNLEENPTVEELLKQVRSTCLEAYSHQDVPFEKLVEEIKPERNMSHSPLFQVMFILQNTAKEELSLPELSLSPVEIDYGIAKFDLTLSLEETEQGLVGTWEYNTDLFERETIERMVNHFQNLLKGIVENPQEKVAKLPLLTEGEKQKILVEWNETEAEYPKDKCIHQLFEEQVKRTPDAIAVVYENQQLTYQELNEKANQLGHYLQKLGVKPDTLVGICVERSMEMVIGLLGILKAGGAYVPIDPNYPQERIEYMSQDSGVNILLTQERLIDRLPKTETQSICLDRDWSEIKKNSDLNCNSGVSSDKLAYVIYTSGSTGKPKGVMIQHQGVVNLAQAQVSFLHVEPVSRILQFASFSFDASVSEVVTALLSGARLILAAKDDLIPGDNLQQTVNQYGITHITLPPSTLPVMSPDGFSNLETIIVAGEACPSELAAIWSQGRNFFNGYGPTEDTVCATVGKYWEDLEKLSIGRPINNTQVYILDLHLQPVPIGVPGELLIGGDGLARGYLNRPDLTAEKFIPNPFGTGKLYKTGDLCRYRRDGNIEYIGRIDHQVKIRGFRIELGEIEAQLSNHPEIRESVVIAREDAPGNKQLVAYVVSDEMSQSSVTQTLRDCLKEQLPDYMIPSAFVLLEKLPLTPNGKINRKALPAPDWSKRTTSDEFVSPQSDTEITLARIWQEILRIEEVGINENFFELGGHSLLATQVISRIREEFSLEIPLRLLFEQPRIANLAESIERSLLRTAIQDEQYSSFDESDREELEL